MKANKIIWMALAILLGVGTGTAGAATNEVSALLQQGLFEEEANQNLDAAIQAYQSVIAQTDKNRQFAATAIFRLGECYRKQGKTNEAAVQYQRILRDYADQPELAKLSGQYLAGMGQSAPGASASSASGTGEVSSEARVLAGQITGIEQLKDNPEEQARAVLAIFPDSPLNTFVLHLSKLEDQAAKLKANPQLAGADLGKFYVANYSDRLDYIAEIPVPASTNLLKTAEAELSKQLFLVSNRVDFIMANQKARLKVLQLASGAPAAPAISDAALQTQKQLLDEEIKIVDQQVQSQQARVKLGVIPQDELASTQMKLLELKRQRAALDTGQFVSPQTSAAATDDEDKELARIQTMVQNTPDLITGSSAELVNAAKNGELRVATFLLDHGANINGSQADSRPLVHAAAQDQKTMVELLLSRRADINVRDNWGETALIDAAGHGYKSVVEVLLAHHTELNSKKPDGDTALHRAAVKGFTDIAGLLITNGADVNAADNSGNTPLHDAAVNNHTAVMALLITHKAAVNAKANDGQTPLCFAVQRGHLDAAALLLKNGADANAKSNGWMPLHAAVAQNNKEMVKLLLDNGADPNARISSFNITDQGVTYGQVADVTPLIMAVINHQPDIVNLLLAHHADINASDASGNTPLIAAANAVDHSPGMQMQFGGMPPRVPSGYPGYANQTSSLPASSVEIAKLLLNNGADVNAQNNGQQSALCLAVINKSSELVKLLLQHKAKVDVGDSAGWTPLRRATDLHAAEIAGSLLDAGADPNVKFPQDNVFWRAGYTMLGMAVAGGDKPLVQVLLSHKADPNLPDDQGQTPLSIARQNQKANPNQMSAEQARTAAEITELLLKAGANENLRRLSTISVSRAGDERTVFTREPNLPNHFSLLDLVTAFYAPPYRGRLGVGESPLPELSVPPGFAHPDFARLTISRLQKDGRTNVIRVDLEAALDAGNCSKDVSLEWGDVVEIPEADHNVNEMWAGLSDAARSTLRKCPAAQVEIMVKGRTNVVTLQPLIYRRNDSPMEQRGIFLTTGEASDHGYADFKFTTTLPNPREQSSFWLYDVVHNANVILTSSDLSRVKVTRKDAATRKSVEMTLDLRKPDPSPANALWLRDGDVIELPEKP